jgi:dipeptidyl-peptidase-4
MRCRLFAPVLLFACPSGVVAQKALEPIDMFRLEYLMVMGAEEPKDWLDGAHYLVFDEGARARPGQAAKRWSAVAAATGKREVFVDRDAVKKSIAALLGNEDGLDEVLDDASAWTWNKDHTHFVLNGKQDLFYGDRAGVCRQLTKTPTEPEVGVLVSPDGDYVSFIAQFNLHIVPAAGGEVRALTTAGHSDLFCGRLDWVYQEELYGRGNFQGYWWSPDSKHIAFLQLDESPVQEFVLVRESPARPEVEKTNYPKTGEPNPIVEIGSISIADGATHWFDIASYPAPDRLVVRVTWAPDSQEVLFQVQGREQTWLDMLAGNPANGAVRKLWREDSDCWVEAGPEPVWLREGAEFLWLSERDGYKHVYHYARDGKLLGRLSEGDWQVKKIVDVDERAGFAYVLSDRASPLQTHLYKLPLAGGELQRITQGGGTHDVSMAPDHATFITRWSDAKTPECVFLRDLEDHDVRTIAKSKTAMLKAYNLAEPHFVQIPNRNGFPMEAMILKPAGFEEGKKYPVVQHTYSGPHAPLVRDQWGSRDFLWHQLLAQQGYVVITCDNESASGKGRKFAKACWRNLGHSEMRDLEDSVDWLVQQGYADPQRFAIWGWSYGGYQTLFNLTHSTKWKCGIAVNPVTDWRNYDTIYTERYGGLPKNEAGYAAGSCVEAAGKLSGSLLLIAASMDDNVHMQNSLQFLAAMQQAGKDCDFMVYPGVRHGIEDLQQQLHLFARFRSFLKEKL